MPIYILIAVRAALPVLRRRRLTEANARRITLQLDNLCKPAKSPSSVRSSFHVRLDSLPPSTPTYAEPGFARVDAAFAHAA